MEARIAVEDLFECIRVTGALTVDLLRQLASLFDQRATEAALAILDRRALCRVECEEDPTLFHFTCAGSTAGDRYIILASAFDDSPLPNFCSCPSWRRSVLNIGAAFVFVLSMCFPPFQTQRSYQLQMQTCSRRGRRHCAQGLSLRSHSTRKRQQAATGAILYSSCRRSLCGINSAAGNTKLKPDIFVTWPAGQPAEAGPGAADSHEGATSFGTRLVALEPPQLEGVDGSPTLGADQSNGLKGRHLVLNERESNEGGGAAEAGDAVHSDARSGHVAWRGVGEGVVAEVEEASDNGGRWSLAIGEGELDNLDAGGSERVSRVGGVGDADDVPHVVLSELLEVVGEVGVVRRVNNEEPAAAVGNGARVGNDRRGRHQERERLGKRPEEKQKVSAEGA
jgi:hypothetical protein